MGREAGESLGRWLRRLREEAGLTQEELAARSGLSVRTVGSLERGRTIKPYPRSIRLLTSTLGLPEEAANELVAQCRTGRDGESASCQPPARFSALAAVSGAPGEEQSPVGNAAVVPRQLPAAVGHFVGRATELKILDGLLEQALGLRDGIGGAVVISAIGGTAGVGKTALAVHWAHRTWPTGSRTGSCT